MDRTDEFACLCKQLIKKGASQVSLGERKRNIKKDKFFIKSCEIYTKLFSNCDYIDNDTLERHGLYLKGECVKEIKRKKKNKEKFLYFINSIAEEINSLKPTVDIHKHILNCLNTLLSVFLEIINEYEQNINEYQYRLNKYTNFYFYDIQNVTYDFHDLLKINNVIYSKAEKNGEEIDWNVRFEETYIKKPTWKSFRFIYDLKKSITNQDLDTIHNSNDVETVKNGKHVETVENEDKKEILDKWYKGGEQYAQNVKIINNKENGYKEKRSKDEEKKSFTDSKYNWNDEMKNDNNLKEKENMMFPKRERTYKVKSSYKNTGPSYEQFIEEEEMKKKEYERKGNEEDGSTGFFGSVDTMNNNNQQLEFKKYVDLFEKEEQTYIRETKQKITKISNMMNVFVNKIYEQNENIKRIENIIEESIENVSQGNVYLSKIQKKKNFNSIIFFALIFAAIFLFIFDFFR